MHQVIEDLKGDFSWSFVNPYSSFQWFALVVTFSGLTVAFILVIGILWYWSRDFRKEAAKVRKKAVHGDSFLNSLENRYPRPATMSDLSISVKVTF